MSQTDLIIHDEKDNVAVVVIDKTTKNQECTGWIMENDKSKKEIFFLSVFLHRINCFYNFIICSFKLSDLVVKKKCLIKLNPRVKLLL